MAAILEGLRDWIGLSLPIAVIGALFLGYLPLGGQILGILGAVQYWGWAWYWAVCLFAWPLVLTVVALAIGGIDNAARKAIKGDQLKGSY